MKKFTVLFAMMLLFTVFAFAQDENGSTMDQPVRTPVEMPWEQVNTGEFTEPIAYPPVRQSDVMYYWTVWRIIDLREKVNHPLYFPVTPQGTWKSLGQLIFDAIDLENPDRTEGTLPVYDDEMCTAPFSREDLISNFSQTTVVDSIDEDGNVIKSIEVVSPFSAYEITQYRVKEVWYFDKQYSMFRVQILEFQPLIEYEKNSGAGGVPAVKTLKNVGFIYYNELRPYLAQQEVFNVKNQAARLSFDDLITWKRDFSSLIYKESNVYNREVQDYITNARDQRIESQRITDKLRTFEHDLWEF